MILLVLINAISSLIVVHNILTIFCTVTFLYIYLGGS
jgi:hypothetical protein